MTIFDPIIIFTKELLSYVFESLHIFYFLRTFLLSYIKFYANHLNPKPLVLRVVVEVSDRLMSPLPRGRIKQTMDGPASANPRKRRESGGCNGGVVGNEEWPIAGQVDARVSTPLLFLDGFQSNVGSDPGDMKTNDR